MTIAFAGGGTGGHFYPIIAIAESLRDLVREKHLLEPDLYYLAPDQFDKEALFANGITYIHIPAGKMRRYFSLKNFTDFFIIFAGTAKAIITLFRIYPDVLMSKGGYGSVPVVIAAHILGIPIIIHESDAKPGRASMLAAPFAKKIAISFESAAAYFPKKVQGKIARTGIPIRKALLRVEKEGAEQSFGLEKGIPTILILGGSQGSVRINEAVITALPDIVSFANVIHQTGRDNFKDVQAVAKVVLSKDHHASRYHPIDYLSELSLQKASGIADVIVSRAGAGAITEIGFWKKPAILIPIPESISHDQRMNAYAYADTGAAIVLEEENITSHMLASELGRLINDPALRERMAKAAEGFADPDAARVLADGVLALALEHES